MQFAFEACNQCLRHVSASHQSKQPTNFHSVPTTALNYGTLVNKTEAYTDGYNIMERIQMTLFSIQEIGISAIYLLEIRKFLRNWGEDTRKLMLELIAVNIALILLDVALLSVEFENLYMIETTLKGMVYSIKLKLEIGVLSKMVKVVESRKRQRTMPMCEEDIDPSKFSSPATFNECFVEEGKKQCSGVSDVSAYHTNLQSQHIERVSSQNYDSLTVPQDATLEQGTFPPARPQMISRQSSIQNLYPGKIEGWAP